MSDTKSRSWTDIENDFNYSDNIVNIATTLQLRNIDDHDLSDEVLAGISLVSHTEARKMNNLFQEMLSMHLKERKKHKQ